MAYEEIKYCFHTCTLRTRNSALGVIADHTAYDVRHRYRPLSEIAMVSISIYLFTVFNWSLLLVPISFFHHLWPNKIETVGKVSEEVNRKSSAWNMTVQLSIPYTNSECHNTHHHRQTDGQPHD